MKSIGITKYLVCIEAESKVVLEVYHGEPGYCKLKQSKFDPFIFTGEKGICIICVDDLLFWEKYEADITQVALSLRDEGVDLDQEDNASVFLGIKLEHDAETCLIEMYQYGLTDRVIAQLVIDDVVDKVKCTPTKAKLLVQD